MLVPRKTDVGTFDLSGGAVQDPNSPEYKYTLAMEYLRRPAPGMNAANRNDNDVQGAKDTRVRSCQQAVSKICRLRSIRDFRYWMGKSSAFKIDLQGTAYPAPTFQT